MPLSFIRLIIKSIIHLISAQILCLSQHPCPTLVLLPSLMSHNWSCHNSSCTGEARYVQPYLLRRRVRYIEKGASFFVPTILAYSSTTFSRHYLLLFKLYVPIVSSLWETASRWIQPLSSLYQRPPSCTTPSQPQPTHCTCALWCSDTSPTGNVISAFSYVKHF
jgi:hypothetical protein